MIVYIVLVWANTSQLNTYPKQEYRYATSAPPILPNKIKQIASTVPDSVICVKRRVFSIPRLEYATDEWSIPRKNSETWNVV